jgi:hypothetical protein
MKDVENALGDTAPLEPIEISADTMHFLVVFESSALAFMWFMLFVFMTVGKSIVTLYLGVFGIETFILFLIFTPWRMLNEATQCTWYTQKIAKAAWKPILAIIAITAVLTIGITQVDRVMKNTSVD